MKFSKPAIFSLVLVAAGVFSAKSQNLTREEYVERFKHIAVAHMEHYGIPASITLAQGILESGNGNSRLAREANNHFGIKCHTDWEGETIYHDDDAKGECFRKYDDPEQSYLDHAEFLSDHRQRRYDSLFVYAPTDYKSWARGLKAAGYATAPDYAERLIRIIEENSLYLLDREGGEALYDSAHGADEGDADLGGESGTAAKAGNRRDENHDGRSTAQTDEGRLDPDAYRVTINAYRGYDVYRCNGVSYILAKKEDSYENIASIFRVSPNAVRKYNEAAEDAQPAEGQVVYIERKRARWEGALLLYTVKEDCVSLLDISQEYGIRLKSLARLNKVKRDAVFTKGRTVKLR